MCKPDGTKGTSAQGATATEVETVWREGEGGKSVQVPKFTAPSARRAASLRHDITMAEVTTHNTKEDVWIVVDGKAYDVTPYVEAHPGGWLPIADMAGRDCTDPFANYHPARVYKHLLPLYLVGDVVDFKETAFQREHRDIRQEFLKAGLFETRPAYYLRLGCWLALLFAAALGLTLGSEGSRALRLLGAAVLGLFFQQLAFVGHDAGHNGVSHSWARDNALGLVVGNLLSGISAGWWKRSHNVHHLVCNSVEHDPDIQHMPVFAVRPNIFTEGAFWSTYHRKEVAFDAAARLLVARQHWLFYPVMFLARFNLYAQSWLLLLDPSEPNSAFGGKARGGKQRAAEAATLLGFAAWFGALVFVAMPTTGGWTDGGGGGGGWTGALCGEWPAWVERGAYLLLSHGVAGVLHVQICLSHFTMETYTGGTLAKDSPSGDEWFQMQLATTMNIDCPPGLDWFHGGLQFQIEHHLWPRLPRHNLRFASEVTRAFCKKHHLRYHAPTWFAAQAELLERLQKTAAVAAAATRGDGGLYHSELWEGLNAIG